MSLVSETRPTHGGRAQPKKALGQHFLVDRHAIERILSIVPPGARVLEIGPGLGAVTEGLLRKANALHLIEKDDRFAAIWQQRAAGHPQLSLTHGDALTCLDEAIAAFRPEWIVGNLPYYISGPLTVKLVRHGLSGGLLLMYQKEVADRIVAKPGNRTYGMLSVLVRHHYHVEPLLNLPPSAFSPMPKVRSTLLVFRPHGHKPVCCYETLLQTLRRGFAHRRKTLANNFRGCLSREDLFALGLDPDTRPECLDYSSWCRLASFLEALSNRFKRPLRSRA